MYDIGKEESLDDGKNFFFHKLKPVNCTFLPNWLDFSCIHYFYIIQPAHDRSSKLELWIYERLIFHRNEMLFQNVCLNLIEEWKFKIVWPAEAKVIRMLMLSIHLDSIYSPIRLIPHLLDFPFEMIYHENVRMHRNLSL